jgi:hypothetical protein
VKRESPGDLDDSISGLAPAVSALQVRRLPAGIIATPKIHSGSH